MANHWNIYLKHGTTTHISVDTDAATKVVNAVRNQDPKIVEIVRKLPNGTPATYLIPIDNVALIDS